MPAIPSLSVKQLKDHSAPLPPSFVVECYDDSRNPRYISNALCNVTHLISEHPTAGSVKHVKLENMDVERNEKMREDGCYEGGCHDSADLVANMLLKMPGLEKFEMSNWWLMCNVEPIQTALAAACELTSLDLSGNYFGTKIARKLCKALKDLPKLTELHLASNEIDKVIEVPPSVRTLDLMFNWLGYNVNRSSFPTCTEVRLDFQEAKKRRRIRGDEGAECPSCGYEGGEESTPFWCLNCNYRWGHLRLRY
jgi:Leucine-rich repeat (LRR) protein